MTRTTARLPLPPYAPATRVSTSPTEYPVPAADGVTTLIPSIAPSKTSSTAAAEADAARLTPLMMVCRL